MNFHIILNKSIVHSLYCSTCAIKYEIKRQAVLRFGRLGHPHTVQPRRLAWRVELKLQQDEAEKIKRGQGKLLHTNQCLGTTIVAADELLQQECLDLTIRTQEGRMIAYNEGSTLFSCQ